jgi:hypothetical protein
MKRQFEADVQAEVAAGLRVKNVLVVLTDPDTSESRLVEIPLVPNDASAESILEGIDQEALWAKGDPVSDQGMMTMRESRLSGYYRNILIAVDKVRASGGTIDMALASGLNEIAKSVKARANFDSMRAWAQLINPTTTEEKRLLLLLIKQFALEGIVMGQG